jgi:hypothetical protein
MKMVLFAAGLAAMAVPAAAQTRVEFRVGSVPIEVALPNGFCAPAGEGVGVAKFIAAADKENVTHLTLFPCTDQSGAQPDYYLVKSPGATLDANAPRAELLASLRAEFDKPEFKSAMQAADVNGKASESYSQLMKQKADISGSVSPMGLDETCAYLGGVLKFESGTVSYSRAISGCITSVGDRVVMIYRYSQGEPGNVLTMMKSARALALAMQAKAGK